MKSFYIDLNGFSKHEIAGAAGKSFKFTQLICAEPNIHGFVMTVFIEKKSRGQKEAVTENSIVSISTMKHEIYSSKKTHFSFEKHRGISVPSDCSLFVQLAPIIKIHECKSQLFCELV